MGEQRVSKEALHRKGTFFQSSCLLLYYDHIHSTVISIMHLPFYIFPTGGDIQGGLYCIIHRSGFWLCFPW